MTIDRMTLKALVEKGSDDDLLREMMAYVTNSMMDGRQEVKRPRSLSSASSDNAQPRIAFNSPS